MRVRIDDADDGAVGRRILAPEGEARFLTPAPEDQLAHARSDGIKRDERCALRLQVSVERLHDEELPPLQRIVLHRRHHTPNDTRELHRQSFTKSTVSMTPTMAASTGLSF